MCIRDRVSTSIFLIFIVIVGWIVYLTNIKQDDSLTMKYYSVQELINKKSDISNIKLGGNIKPNSIEISEDDQLEAFFYVYQNQDSVKVYYYGIRPDLFTDDAEVVVSGSYSNNLITAKELQTKCASRYEGDLKNVEKI